MSVELNDLSKEFGKDKPKIIRKDISLYRTTISTASAAFLREVDQECKKKKQADVTLIALIPESTNKSC